MDDRERILLLEQELELIKRRNVRVEIDKAWEVSLTRRLSILFLTYILMNIIFYLLGSKSFYLDAIIPTVGYLLSTQSISLIKGLWLLRHLPKGPSDSDFNG